MFIHLGGDTVVSTRDVIGIFDIEIKSSNVTESFFENAESMKMIEILESGEIKSFVVTEDKVYFSPISSVTLKRRANFLDTVIK